MCFVRHNVENKALQKCILKLCFALNMAESESKPDVATSAGYEKPRGKHRFRRKKNKGGEQKPPMQEQSASPPKDKFTGRCEELNGFIFDISYSKGGLGYIATSEEIARYVGLKNNIVGSYVRTAIMTLVEQTPNKPTATDSTDVIDTEIFKEEVRMYVKNARAIKIAMKSLYDLLWGQCSETMRSRLRAIDKYATISAEANSISLLKAIRAEMTGFKEKQYLVHSIHNLIRDFFKL